MKHLPRLMVGALAASLALGACQAAPASSNLPSPSPAASSLATVAPSATAGPDTAALLAAQYEQITSGILRLDGTIVIGTVQATFSGSSRSNGPDEASTLTTTVGDQASTEQHVRVGGTRYVQKGTGPWLVDS